MLSPPLRPSATAPVSPAASSTASSAQPRPAAIVGAVAVFVAYFASLHVLVVGGLAPWLALGLIVAPWVVVLSAWFGSGSRKGLQRIVTVVTAVVLSAVAWAFGDRLAGRVEVVLYVENLVFLIALCSLFAVTLFRGREPLITRLARVARGGHLPSQALGYTRRVTIVWAAFFAAMAAISTLLFATQSRAVWSTFVNLLLWPSMAVLFALEYAVRLRVLRDIAHVSMMSGVDAFRRRGADPSAGSATPGPCE